MHRFRLFISVAAVAVMLFPITYGAYAQAARELPAKTFVTVQNAPARTPSEASIGVPNQIIGALKIRATGGDAIISRLVFKTIIDGARPSVPESLENVSLFDEHGVIVAGPVDAGSGGAIILSDTISIRKGSHTYTVRGRLRPSAVSHGQVIRLITRPSIDWLIYDVKSGRKIIAPPLVVALSPVSVGMGTISVYKSSTAVTSTAHPGTLTHVFAYVILDATKSFDDLRVTDMQYTFETSQKSPIGLKNCGLYDQKTLVTSILYYPFESQKYTFPFVPTFTVSEKTKKELALTCDIASEASGSYRWSISETDLLTAVSVQSGIDAISTIVPFVGTAIEVTP
ncbi:MAG: hypothetical protein G01um101429_977 [Parcubacteria group bacterium Gr01-1014_29]|nr:MAG: hypothetical protein G01um101429_977 [Parcubacteria group bacterium Gr01-1014_29]